MRQAIWMKIPVILSLLLSGCNGVEVTEKTIIEKPPQITTVDQYFSPITYGPLQRLYYYDEAKLILKLKFLNNNKEMPLSAKLYRFSDDADAKSIEKWINNQHSDALFADAAAPVETKDVRDEVSVLQRQKTGKASGRKGEAYEAYEVSYNVSEIVSGNFLINAFEDKVTVHVLLTAE